MDEETPHMHLIFLPVVHTADKKGNDIDKLACSEFWKDFERENHTLLDAEKQIIREDKENEIGMER